LCALKHLSESPAVESIAFCGTVFGASCLLPLFRRFNCLSNVVGAQNTTTATTIVWSLECTLIA
jgi:hypothetical protein